MTKAIEPGCLAIVVAQCPCPACLHNAGKIVTVTRATCVGDILDLGVAYNRLATAVLNTPGWFATNDRNDLVTFTPFFGSVPVREAFFYPSELKRIDYPDGQDETLTWAPVKQGVPA